MPEATNPPGDAVWTVGRIIDWTTQHLRRHGSETPRLDAEILLAHALECPRIQLYVRYAEPLSEAARSVMRDLVRRRAAAEPVAYLVGHREFFGLNFRVTPDVLIPRPETETLVLELLTSARKKAAAGAESLRVLDLGTGSGCIAVATAVNLSRSAITAVDISPKALSVARQNAERHRVADRIEFLEGDLFAPLRPGQAFDFIVSNPPYVADAEIEQLAPDVRSHEPHLALRAGPRGLDLIERIVAGAGAYLAPGGVLLIEIAPEQAPAVSELLAAAAIYEPARMVKDASGALRVAEAARREA